MPLNISTVEMVLFPDKSMIRKKEKERREEKVVWITKICD